MKLLQKSTYACVLDTVECVFNLFFLLEGKIVAFREFEYAVFTILRG